MSDRPDIVSLLADRAAALDVVYEYFAVVDERRWADWADVLAPDVVVDLTFDQRKGRDAVIRWASSNLADMDATQHVAANPQVRVSGDTATANVTLVTTHVRTAGQAEHRLTAGGFYTFTLRREKTGRWLICRAANRIVWSDGDPRGPAAAVDARSADHDPTTRPRATT